MVYLDLRSHVQEIRGEEDAATEAHQQAEDALAATTLTVHASFHMMRQNSEDERQQERQDEANQLRQPTIHRSVSAANRNCVHKTKQPMK